jgi:transposase
MPKQSTATAFDHDSTLVLALELSGKGWEVGAVLPGVVRRPRRSLPARDMAALLQQIERWKAEVLRAGRTVCRTVLAYEAGRDGFWIARYLLACGIEVQIMHPASIPVKRIGSISTCCCARCWPGCEVSRACARSCAFRARPRRT